MAVYERRPGSSGVPHAVDPDMSREQQLEAEVAELRFVDYNPVPLSCFIEVLLQIGLESR